MRYFIRTHCGRDLEVSSGKEVVMLFRQRFLDPSDEIRAADSERWRKIQDIPEYAAMIRRDRDDRVRFKVVFYVVTVVSLLLLFAMQLRRYG